MMKTQWRPVPCKKYPGWATRRVVTGGYTAMVYRQRSGIRSDDSMVSNMEDVAIAHPLLVQYQVLRNGRFFFSANTKAQAMRVIRKYYSTT